MSNIKISKERLEKLERENIILKEMFKSLYELPVADLTYVVAYKNLKKTIEKHFLRIKSDNILIDYGKSSEDIINENLEKMRLEDVEKLADKLNDMLSKKDEE
jgi:hypothetical protein